MASSAPVMTQAEFARHRGVSKKTITLWKQRGLLVMDADGRVDVAASEARLQERPASYRGGVVTAAKGNAEERGNAATAPDRPAPTGRVLASADPPEPVPAGSDDAASATWNLAEAQRRKEIALARQRELEFDTARGRLVAIEAVGTLVERDYAVVRNRLLAIPGKIAASLVGLPTERIMSALAEEIAEALHELHDPAGIADRARQPGSASGESEGGA